MKWLLACALAACGSMPAPAQYSELCATGCVTSRPDACLSQSSAGCQSDCVSDTSGRPAACAQCIADHITWRTSLCDPSTGMCSAGAMTCTGWSIPRPTSMACQTACS